MAQLQVQLQAKNTEWEAKKKRHNGAWGNKGGEDREMWGDVGVEGGMTTAAVPPEHLWVGAWGMQGNRAV